MTELVPVGEAVRGELVSRVVSEAARFCEQQQSADTARTYRSVLRRYATFSEAMEVRDLNVDSVIAYEQHLRSQNARPSVLRTQRVAINAFVKFLIRMGYEVDERILQLPLPKYKKQTNNDVPSLRRSEYEKLVDAAEARITKKGNGRGKRRAISPAGIRDYAMICILGDCGLRSMELRKLRMKSVVAGRKDSQRLALVVDGKGSYQRTVPLTARAQEALATWGQVREELGIDSEWLFVGFHKGGERPIERDGPAPRRPIDAKTLERVVKRLGREAGLDYLTVHTLRHTYATLALAVGMPLQLLQKRMGHASIKTTERYVHVDADALDQELALLDGAIDSARKRGAL